MHATPASHSKPLEFIPGTGNSTEYRNALGQFGTGVTIVTTSSDQGPIGITVNSFASVSLEPALVLWSPAKRSRHFSIFESAPHYVIHVLDHAQAELAAKFARDPQSFNHCDWHLGENNNPLIENTVARFECERLHSHDGGDHAIVVGRVLRAANYGGEPLMFVGGQYGRFTGAARTGAA